MTNTTPPEGPIQILGFMLVRNEDRFVASAIRNALPLCDRFLILDNQSTDQTRNKIKAVIAEHPQANLELIDLSDVRESHGFLEPFMGNNWWIFAVDGDEIYDPKGLKTLKGTLQAGTHQDVWQVFGHVLHVTQWDANKSIVKGYRTPPARPMTKLYNFSLVESWSDCPERLHGGTLVLKQNQDPQTSRYVYAEHYDWENSPFRCLHMVFIRRSSQTQTFQYRDTPTENLQKTLFSQNLFAQCKYMLYQKLRVIRKKTGKDRAYRRGVLTQCDALPFNVKAYE